MKYPIIFVLSVLFLFQASALGQDVQGSVAPDRLSGNRTSPQPPTQTPPPQLPPEPPTEQEAPAVPAPEEGATPPPPSALPGTKQIVGPAQDFHMSQFMLFIVDVSGSMSNQGRIGAALDRVRRMMEDSTDEYYIAVIAFNGDFVRWQGINAPNVPKGWAIMPSDASRHADQWLSKQSVAGNTNPSVAIRAALFDPNQPLSIILITDGEFNEGHPPVQMFRERQAARRARGLNEASLVVIGVGAATEQNAVLRQLGEEGNGGFYVQE